MAGVRNSLTFASGSFNQNTSSCLACGQVAICPDLFGCPPDRTPDFSIKRHDTMPPIKIMVEDCDGPLNVQGLVVEANMWAISALKCSIDETIDYISLVDNIGFEQIMVGDVIIMDRVRLPEKMLVIAFDENNKLVQVQRGYRNTTPQAWKKGSGLRIFRIMNAPAETEMIFADEETLDGTTNENVLQESFLVYDWQPEDTCLPGCYWMEFKLLKMQGLVLFLPGGFWVGSTHVQSDGFTYTGSTQTDSSVRLSLDNVTKQFILPDTVWTGAFHLFSGQNFTGTVHNDGSVFLSNVGVPDSTSSFDSDGMITAMSANMISIIPSFTDSGLTPYYFGCILGEGVEWVRRFPSCGEGFLIQIIDSPTSEAC